MIGISNVLSAEDEISQSAAAIANFDARTKQTGKIPGTHSLGVQFRTRPNPEATHALAEALQFRKDETLVENLLGEIFEDVFVPRPFEKIVKSRKVEA